MSLAGLKVLLPREALEVGAFTWSRIQRLYDSDPAVHWQRCAAEGLECPQDVFTQLFHLERHVRAILIVKQHSPYPLWYEMLLR